MTRCGLAVIVAASIAAASFVAACGADEPASDQDEDVIEDVIDSAVDESCRDPITFVQDIERDAWVLVDGSVSPDEPAQWSGYLQVSLPAGAERLERVDDVEGAWPGVMRSTDLGEVDVIAMTPEVIDAVNAAGGPVLLGLTEFVNFGFWRTSTTFDVFESGELQRQLTCAEFQRREVMEYWERARAAGFDGTALEFTIIATEALLVDLTGP